MGKTSEESERAGECLNDKTTVIIYVHAGLTLSRVLKVVTKPKSPNQKVCKRKRRQRKRNLKLLLSYYDGIITFL